MILLTLSRGKGEETVRLQLPASPAEIGETFAFLDRISLDTTATAILDVSSNVPVLYRCLYDVDVEDSEQFQKLQKLAERTEALSPAKAAIFSGALDAECVWNLEGALTVADRLDEYMLVNNVSSDSELGIYLVNKGITPFPDRFKPYINYARVGAEYGNPVGYRTEQGVVADSMFRREELEDWLARKGLAVRWEDGIYDRLSSGGYQKAADNGPALKSCRIWQLGPSAPAAMRFIGLDRMSGEYGGPDLTRYQAVFDGTVSTNSLDGIWEAFCRRSLGSDGQPLAISDLVELYDDSGSEFYYVDRTAIVPVQLKAPEQESGMTMTL